MAEQHDKSKKKAQDHNLEIPHDPALDEIEVVDDVLEVVEEEAPIPAAEGEDVQTVEDVIEVFEEAPEPKKTFLAYNKVAPKTQIGAEPGKPTQLADHDPSQTMLAPDMVHELDSGTKLGGSAAGEHVDLSAKNDEILEAEEASDPRMEQAAPGGEKPLGSDTHADVDLGAEVMDVVEAVPSSASIAAALAESDEDVPPQKPPEATAAEESDRTIAFDSSKHAVPPASDETQMDVVVEYEEVLVDGESEVDLGKKSGSKGERPSGVDIIAEALESGVDLDHAAPPPPKALKAEDSDAAFESILNDDIQGGAIDSSAVDLGSGQSEAFVDVPEPQAKPRAHDEGATEEASDAGIHQFLDSGATELSDDEEILVTPKRKTIAASATELEQEQDQAAGLSDDDLPKKPRGKKAAAEGEGEGGGTATLTRTKPRSRVIPFLLGGILATLLLTAGIGAVWYAAPNLLGDIAQESPNALKKTTPKTGGQGVVNPPVTGPVGPVASKAQEARKLIDDGKFDEALELTKEDAEKKDKEAQVVHGLATFMKLQKEAKTPLTEKDEAVKKALDEIALGEGKGVLAEIQSKLALNAALLDQFAAVEAAKDKSTKLDALEKLLTDAKLPSDAGKLKATVDDLYKAWDATTGTMKSLAAAKLIGDKQPVDAAVVTKAVDELIKARETLNDSVVKLTDTVEKVNGALIKAGAKDGYIKGVEELAALRESAVKDRDALNVAIDAALKELKDGNYLTADADKTKQLVESTKKARLAGQSPLGSSLNAMVGSLGGLSKEPLGIFKKVLDNAKTAAALKTTQLQLALSESPDERLDMIVAVLKERGTTDAKIQAGFKNFMDWVRSKESNASPEARVKAVYAAGLMERNRDDFAAARKLFEEAVKEAKSLKSAGTLETAAKQSLAELTDPNALYLPRALTRIAEGQFKLALDDLNAGLKVLPGNGQLLLKRAEVELQLAMVKGKIDEPTQKRIREDAEGARKDAKFAAESYFVTGLLDESLGDFGHAESAYREALKLAAPGPQSDRYRIALARILQRSTGLESPEEEPAGDDDEETDPLLFCSTPTVAEAQGDDDAKAAKRLEESIKLANELIQSPDAKTRGEGFILLGSAQARLGKKTEGLKNFVKGLELVNPGMAMQDLAKIVETHPAFSQPDVALQSNPVQAERSFGKGLELFWAKKYAQAEEEFKKAISSFDQDARYRYFLGLSRYQQDSKEKKALAAFDFEQGARLEAARKPGAREINASLERVQGDLRRVLNAYREKAAAAS